MVITHDKVELLKHMCKVVANEFNISIVNKYTRTWDVVVRENALECFNFLVEGGLIINDCLTTVFKCGTVDMLKRLLCADCILKLGINRFVYNVNFYDGVSSYDTSTNGYEFLVRAINELGFDVEKCLTEWEDVDSKDYVIFGGGIYGNEKAKKANYLLTRYYHSIIGKG